MRISTNMIFEQQVRGITDSQASWLKVGEQLSSGRRVTNPSDDPIAASRAVVLTQTQQQGEQYALARTFAEQGLSLEDNTLKGVTNGIIAAQALIVNGSTGTLSDDDRGSIATQLEGVRAQLLNLANSKDANGRYIFAGYKTDSAPFVDTAGTGVSYAGGTDAITQKVDTSRTMTVAHTGDSIFMSITSNATVEPDGSASETNLFKMLDSAIAALKVPQDDADAATKQTFQDAMDKTNRGLGNALNNVSTVVSEIGTQLGEIDTLNAQGDDRKVIYSSQMSDLVNVDLTEAASSYTMQQTALQASYKTFTDMSKMSLFQMNS
ncbi:flagellar hook-filament junction protein FlgL [Pantoea sp. Bo_2]|uniref:flagellar hook-associated protein FlgL n=1 Tax=unclassified Pantoea TaxID=2630326 RepID=UPI001231A099|nr:MULTISPECIES: flagellar hook-associated protein FlgL [unclassified Pantoea]KAA5950934.1 flagellar hook-filament junction protein FlgL [Pantoea sp. VH_3]KAA5956282.1 flagellar hook-filament junction protein FlgL [Pantoea sp. VH_25]KAA5959303.1 flagellar hook-filament junction protein FlgL [Pantoea sp. VH_24]KAA5963138.1 flagellar hook-filament junction protein FlgL [Pantoea sp. VH_16]KAA5967313.1 flagellar hook-filament junction protein FlgL [Pantoea sp. VH_18]